MHIDTHVVVFEYVIKNDGETSYIFGHVVLMTDDIVHFVCHISERYKFL